MDNSILDIKLHYASHKLDMHFLIHSLIPDCNVLTGLCKLTVQSYPCISAHLCDSGCSLRGCEHTIQNLVHLTDIKFQIK